MCAEIKLSRNLAYLKHDDRLTSINGLRNQQNQSKQQTSNDSNVLQVRYTYWVDLGCGLYLWYIEVHGCISSYKVAALKCGSFNGVDMFSLYVCNVYIYMCWSVCDSIRMYTIGLRLTHGVSHSLKSERQTGHDSKIREKSWTSVAAVLLGHALVGGWALPLWKIWKSDWIIIPTIEGKKTCSKPPTSAKILECLGSKLLGSAWIYFAHSILDIQRESSLPVWYIDPHIPDRKIILWILGCCRLTTRVNPLVFCIFWLGDGSASLVLEKPWQQKKTAMSDDGPGKTHQPMAGPIGNDHVKFIN